MRLFGSHGVTGIDIGSGSIKVVRLARGGQRPALLSAALIEIPPDPSAGPGINSNLRALAAEGKIGRKNVMTLLSGRDLTVRLLTLPKMPASELGEAVRWEAKRHISFPLDAAQIEYVVVGDKQDGLVGKLEIIMVAVEREKVLQHLVPFSEAGIVVSAVDSNALALRNVLRLRDLSSEENMLVVDIGAGKTEINIFKGDGLRFSRCIESGGIDMTRGVSDALEISMAEAEDRKRSLVLFPPSGQDQAGIAVRSRLDGLLREVRRSIEYYKTTFREKGVEKTLLTGGVAQMRGIPEYFSRTLEGAVELADPLEGLTCDAALRQELDPVALRLTSAIGLALRKA